jgi:hypothetical protein
MRMMHLDFGEWAMLSGLPAFLLSGVFTAGQTTSTQTPSQNSVSNGATRDQDHPGVRNARGEYQLLHA